MTTLTNLREILIKSKEEEFHLECEEIVKRVDHIKSLLIKISDNGGLQLPLTIRGAEVRMPEYEKDLNLLERCGLVKSRVRFTEHNSYRVYEISGEGATLVKNLS